MHDAGQREVPDRRVEGEGWRNSKELSVLTWRHFTHAVINLCEIFHIPKQKKNKPKQIKKQRQKQSASHCL